MAACTALGFLIGAAVVSVFQEYEAFVSFSVVDLAQALATIVLGTFIAVWLNKRSIRDSLAFGIYARVLRSIVESLDQLEREAGELYSGQMRQGERREARSPIHDMSATLDSNGVLHALRELNNHVNNLKVLCEAKNSLLPSGQLWRYFFEKGLHLKKTLTQEFPVSLSESKMSEIREISCAVRLRVMEIETEIVK